MAKIGRKSFVIAAILTAVSCALFYIAFTQGLLFVYDFLGLYNVATFGFILGEAAAVALIALILFLPPILFMRSRIKNARAAYMVSQVPNAPPKLRNGPPAYKYSVPQLTICAISFLAGVFIIVQTHIGFFRVISLFLLYNGFSGPAVTIGVAAPEIICGLMCLMPAILLTKRYIGRRRKPG